MGEKLVIIPQIHINNVLKPLNIHLVLFSNEQSPTVRNFLSVPSKLNLIVVWQFFIHKNNQIEINFCDTCCRMYLICKTTIFVFHKKCEICFKEKKSILGFFTTFCVIYNFQMNLYKLLFPIIDVSQNYFHLMR